MHVIAIMAQGGAERLVLELAADATSRGDAVAVASGGGPWTALLADVGARDYRLARHRRSPLHGLVAVERLRRAIRDFRPDVIHSHNVGVTALARFAIRAARSDARLVTTFHGVPPEQYGRAAPVLARSTKEVVACSHAVGRSLVAAGYPVERVTVVPNAARFEAPSPDRVSAMRERLGIGERPLVVGVGRLVPQKEWETLVDAAAELDDIEVVVAGEGELHEQLQRRAAANAGGVRFLGFVDDVAALVACADCVVSTSRWEGLPLTLLEAVSLGVPVVCTAVDGVLDVLSEEAAYFVAPGDPRAVAAAITAVLADPERARRMATAGRVAVDAWSPEAMLERYRGVYEAAGRPAGIELSSAVARRPR